VDKLYWTWREVLKKSKKLGIKQSWDTFEEFKSYLGDKPLNHELVRKDAKAGFVIGNVAWMLPIHGPYFGRKHRKIHPLKQCWRGMMRRCFKASNKEFVHYGGRGITVCERWKTFRHFKEDMGVRPEGAQIDRIDVNKGYEPSNCRWVYPETNQRNKRNTIYVWHSGMKLDLMSACQLTGKSHKALRRRMERAHGERSWQDCFDSIYALNRDALYQRVEKSL
jgi:hypothetical protein